MQADCVADPFCVKCIQVGHTSAMCPQLLLPPEPCWAGFGGEGAGFFCCEVPEQELERAAFNSAQVYIEKMDLSTEDLGFEQEDWWGLQRERGGRSQRES